MRAKGAALLALVLLNAGCAIEPDKTVQEATNRPAEMAAATWAATGVIADVENGWIGSFASAQLSSLVNEALENNLNLQALAANVEQSQALARQAGAALVPSVSVSGSSGRSGLSESGRSRASYDVGLAVSWELDMWGRLRSGVEQAQASAQAAEADYLFAQYSVAANTAIAYFAAIDAATQVDVARLSLDLLEKTLRITNVRYDEGMASAQELALARADIAATRDQQLAREGAMRNALRALELLLGRYPAADIDVSGGLPELPAPPPAGLPSELLERRPDLVAAERQVAAAFNAVTQARAAQLPQISLTSSLGGASGDLSQLLNPGNVAWSIGANLLAPLYDGGRLRENVTIANAQQSAVLASYGEAALRAFSEVETALDQQQVLMARQAEQQIALAEAERAFALAEAQYAEGEISLVDLLGFQQRVIQNRSVFESTRRLGLDNRVQLHLALGGAWE
ncbi:efflux transporter outer membrane subunit [Congregibacter brevis]|uniref:Efflux transporter outer membrane subunit n=1 Tax=Congregibacter brevis TaxID=3081201 RepID=A0ABZ0IHJ3_9GAMM|nr:efflux transporter outer membrane subunit [Congregibacter sp. IMCC45268]